ncbi:M4 family metallopeptidase [Streptomyces sp. NBC_01362]|uniref:M4 family metallopeptidase n=1 Tax=Streptomyces sp. NBC_01362 TaxID=2903839 RepID=UPI002E328013|nr:M4 family metallopeptidase [Streptomyces sp. NBC_01362]
MISFVGTPGATLARSPPLDQPGQRTHPAGVADALPVQHRPHLYAPVEQRPDVQARRALTALPRLALHIRRPVQDLHLVLGGGQQILGAFADGLRTHGVVESTANLVYAGQSGAMNEAIADCFGNAIDVTASGTAMDDPDGG